jgi:RNA polymerase sigma-54 factor
MKAGLHLRQSQHMALTPQLQQSIRLLQLSTLELQQEIEQMLDANPFLDVVRDDEDDGRGYDLAAPKAADANGDASGDGPSSQLAGLEQGGADGEGGERDGGLDADSFGSTEREDWSNGTEGDDFDGIRETRDGITSGSTAQASGDDSGEAPEREGEGPSLAEHLRSQLVGMRLSATEAAAVHALIDSLNDDGYLEESVADMAQRLAGGEQTSAEDLEDIVSTLQCALRWLQSMEPLGVGARDLPDCLTLQLRAKPRCEAQAIAILIAKHHLELLAKRDYKKLSAATGAEEPLLKEAQALIVSCDPKPGRAFSRTEHHVVVPDVLVRKSGRGLKVMLNPDVMPKLRINDVYAQALRGQRGQGELGVRLQEARWFLKNIKQRFDTILRVTTAIVERQRSFFTHGEIAMRPLVLREIADELGLHESTISRVTTAKYMATPQGTFELKYFFGSSLATQAGGNASSTAVRALIRQFVGAECHHSPLSDNQLATMLSEQGITVARRTVAKYRDALRIAPANLRREA